jgi:hypothetical protein
MFGIYRTGDGKTMSKSKFTEKLKEGVSVKEIEEFTRQHTIEVFSVFAIIIATISSCWDYFFGGPKLALFFLSLATIFSILFPVMVERFLKQFYNFSLKQEKTTQLIIGAVKIVVALFIPFLIFAVLGFLAGSSYHYYVRHAQIVNENKPPKSEGEGTEGSEHD